MAGRGPAPKDPSRRVRRNKDAHGLTVIHADPVDQPDLPQLTIRDDGNIVVLDWPDITREWWRMWAESPLSKSFTATDWSELRDAARLHAMFWLGDKSLAAELRLRVAKFGATPEDRARLRIQFAQADDAEAKRKPKAESASDRYGNVRRMGEAG